MNLGAGRNSSAAVARPLVEDLGVRAEQAVDAACDYLLNRQTSEGYWVGEAEGDTTLESDYVLLQLWLHQPDGNGTWNPPTRTLVDAACRRIADKQLEDGGWSIYPHGPANTSASVKAYCALKLGGYSENGERLRRAAARIVDLGGIEAANSYTKLYLSYFGLYPRSEVPSIPPEIFLLPTEHRFSIYSMSSWSRAMLAPLSILDATRAHRRVPAGFLARRASVGTPCDDASDLELEAVLPAARQGDQVSRVHLRWTPPPEGDRSSARLDGREAGAVRRPRRDLSGHGEFDHGADAAGL